MHMDLGNMATQGFLSLKHKTFKLTQVIAEYMAFQGYDVLPGGGGSEQILYGSPV